MKRFFIFLLTLFLSFELYSQAQVQVDLDIKVLDYASEKKIQGASVEVFDGNTVVKSGITPTNGNVKFTVPSGKKYKIVVSKAGKVTRYFFVDSKGIEAEFLQGKNKILVGPDIKLFDQIANVDYSFVESNPITEFYFDLTSNSIEYDQAMAIKMQKKIDAIIAEAQKKDSQNDAMYQKAIEGGDSWYKQKKYDLALAKYEEAALLKPKEQYPKDKIKELDALLKTQKEANLANQQKEEQYKSLIAAADALRDQKKYSEAIAKYNEALKIKDEQYPKDQVSNANKLIENAKKEAELEASFKALITSANQYFDQKSYTPAKDKYLEALKLKPADEYAKKRISEIDAKLKETQAGEEKKKKYNYFISEGDELLAAKKYNEAKGMFNQAIALDNIPTYPKDKIKEIDLKIAEEAKNAEKNSKYQATMKLADELLATNKLNEAKIKYQEALSIDPSQSLPKEKIAKIDQQLSSQAEIQKTKEKIANLLKEGNALLLKNDLNTSKLKFEEVLKLEANNLEATAKLKEINTKLNQQQSQAQLDEKFKALKIKGAEQFKAESYNEAKNTFTEAKTIKSDPEIEKYLKDIDAKLLGEQAFQKLMQEGASLESSNIDGAIAKYKEALSKKPNSEEAKKKIADLEKVKANKLNQVEVDKKYQAAMKKANDAFTAKKYLDAIKLYNEALAIKPDEKEPVEKAAQAQKLEEGNKSDAEQQYAKILEVGQTNIDEKKWDKAKELYNRAANLRPNDVVPKNKLKEIDQLIKAEQDAKLNQAEKDKNYTQKIKDAELAANGKDYDKAISLFQQAQTLKPEEKLPPKRIQELTDLKNKSLDANKQEALYKEYISKGDKAVQAKSYEEALSEYKNALGIKNNDKIAQGKISEVQQLIDNENNKNAFSKVKAEFDALVKEGDQMYADKNWKDARAKYEQALNLISSDKYAKNQVDACIKNIKNKPDEDIQYQKIISKADEYFGKLKYDKAKELYERALTLKSSDPYPKLKLDEIQSILNPKIVKQAEPLNILGEPNSESPDKVHEALVKAEIERKNKKNTTLKSKAENIQNNSTETSQSKKEQILNSANSISEIEKRNQIRDTRADENRENTVNEVRKNEIEMASLQTSTQNQKYYENINNKEFTNIVVSENSKISEQSKQSYEANSKTMKVVSKTVEDQNYEDKSTYYQSNIKSQGELAQTKIKYDEKVGDDFESRKAVERAVNSTKDSINANDYQALLKKNSNSLEISNKVEEEKKNIQIKSTKDAESSKNNKENIKTIENKVSNKSINDAEKSLEISLKADEIVNNNQKQLYTISENQDKVRLENVELVQSGKKSIYENQDKNSENNIEKTSSSQQTISKNIVKLDAFSEIEKNSAEKKFDAVDRIDKQSAKSLTEQTMSDDEQRLYAKSTVSSIDQSNSNHSTEKGKKVDDNISSMKSMTDDLNSNQTKSANDKEDQLKNAQVLIDKVSSKQVKYDDKVANELGTLYPEGVSQEVFNQNDENGLLKAVVTRRIVVKNGFGQIYIRTQSLSGITYSKNGNPSSEFIWQKETNDTKLTKNY
jgi:epidermal growth factor receptor substrate 15